MEAKGLKRCRRAFRKQVVEITGILMKLQCKYCKKENIFNITIDALYSLFIKADENVPVPKNMQMRSSYNVTFDYA